MEFARYNTVELDQFWFAKQTSIYFCMWVVLYLTIHYLVVFKDTKKKQAMLHDKLVSTFHGTLTFCNASYFVYYNGIDFEVGLDFFSAHIMAFSLGYFMYDLLQCYIMGLADIKLLIHHGFCFLTFGFIGLTQRGIFLGIAGLSMAESSSFTMNMRGICKLMQMQHTKMLELFEVLYFLTYITFRGLFSPVFIVMAAFSPSTPVFAQFSVFVIFLQSVSFMKIMFSICVKKWTQYQERQRKGIPLFWFSKNPDINTLDYFNQKKSHNLF